MSERCTTIDELLERGDLEGLERHVAECPVCGADAREWDAISEAARGLHTEWESPALLPRIEREIARSVSARGGASRFGARTATLVQIAATILLVVGLATLAGRVIGPAVSRAGGESSYDDWVLRESAIDEVERAEKTHLASIDRLSKLAAPTLERNDSPLVVSYREKLMLLDDAIAECQAQIEQNRYNAHLRRQLLAVYQEKDQTLRDLLEDERHVQ